MSWTTRGARVASATVAALVAPLTVLATGPAAYASDDAAIFADPGEPVTVEFAYQPEQYEWIVPGGVSEITVELSAGSGAGAGDAPGGVGGLLTVRVPVESGETLLVLVGAAGSTSPVMAGGEGSALARATGSLLAVAGGGGASFRCGGSGLDTEFCGAGGAGGFSSRAGGVAGLAGTAVSPLLAGQPGESGAAGQSVGFSSNAVAGVSAVQPDPFPASVGSGTIRLAPPTDPPVDTLPQPALLGGGGGGFFAAGHGGANYSIDPFDNALIESGGGGGGSGYVDGSVEVLELGDNVGDGFASITYTVPEPEVVPAPGPGLELASTIVTAGSSVRLTGSRFDPERAYPVILNSDPILLGTITTDVSGGFDTVVLIPASVPAGDHVITVGDARIPITVEAASPSPPAGDGARLADVPAPAPELAATGVGDWAPAIGLVALGSALLGLVLLPMRRGSRRPGRARRATTPAR